MTGYNQILISIFYLNFLCIWKAFIWVLVKKIFEILPSASWWIDEWKMSWLRMCPTPIYIRRSSTYVVVVVVDVVTSQIRNDGKMKMPLTHPYAHRVLGRFGNIQIKSETHFWPILEHFLTISEHFFVDFWNFFFLF
jgi:hypothetical protein